LKYVEFALKFKNTANAAELSRAALYFVFGDDEYLKDHAVKVLEALAGEEYADFNVARVDFSDGADGFIDALYTFPVFSDVKTVVADVGEKLSEADKKALLAYLENPNSTSVGVLRFSQEADKSFLKSAEAEYIDCSHLNGAELENEIQVLLALPPSKKMDAAAAKELAKRAANDMTRIDAELKKLKAYADDTIALSDVAELVPPDTDFQIYELSGAVSEKNTAKALEVLDSFMKSGVRPMTVLGLLYNQYRKMLHTELHKSESDAEVAAVLNVKPAAVYYTRKVSKNYSQLKLKQCTDMLHGFQCDVVNGRRSEGAALNEAVIRLLSV
jgi:DNA polymerase-3 subunit delta